jgi:predicted nucleic acid-binding protein
VKRIVLDAGALIALERNERGMWAALKLAALKGADVLVPSTALAQVWRGTASQAQLSKALDHCIIAAFDTVARDVGELCGRTRTADICDAHVAIIAARHGDVLYTSDAEDMRRLVASCGRRKPAILRC